MRLRTLNIDRSLAIDLSRQTSNLTLNRGKGCRHIGDTSVCNLDPAGRVNGRRGVGRSRPRGARHRTVKVGTVCSSGLYDDTIPMHYVSCTVAVSIVEPNRYTSITNRHSKSNLDA